MANRTVYRELEKEKKNPNHKNQQNNKNTNKKINDAITKRLFVKYEIEKFHDSLNSSIKMKTKSILLIIS